METISCKKCGAVDDYKTSQNGPHVEARCNQCKGFIKFLPQTYLSELKMPIGKYAGRRIADLADNAYLTWFLANVRGVNPRLKQAITDQILKLSQPV